MKKTFLVIFFLSFAFGFGQNSTAPKEAPIVADSNTTLVEKKAEPIGGIKKFYTQLSSNMIVPEVEVAGVYRTKVKFVVNQDGSLSDFQILEETPSSVGLGQNVIRYLKSIENWIPSE
ncbi:hypothetical protein [Flavobacterium terrigena]|nr:hypothetical protein [Flavobacterium terrigena]